MTLFAVAALVLLLLASAALFWLVADLDDSPRLLIRMPRTGPPSDADLRCVFCARALQADGTEAGRECACLRCWLFAAPADEERPGR